MAGNSAIRIDSITVSFGAKTVLDSFSLMLDPGEKVILTGKSGAGKTTVLRAILGFVTPERGTLAIEGETLTAESVWRIRPRLAYVAQESDLGEGTVREVIERPFSYRANSHLKGNLKRLEPLFEEFYLPSELLRENVSNLSGGEKQRAALVSAILLDRRIFLLDEPSSALDAQSREAVAAFFRDRADLTVLSVAHDAQAFSIGGRTAEVPTAGGAR